MTSYERVTYRPEGARRSRTIILQNAQWADSPALGPVLTGVEVDREGTEVAPRGVDVRRHVISLALVTGRVPLVMDNTYGELVAR